MLHSKLPTALFIIMELCYICEPHQMILVQYFHNSSPNKIYCTAEPILAMNLGDEKMDIITEGPCKTKWRYDENRFDCTLISLTVR